VVVPEVVAHRGASGSAPENTLAAFRRAAQQGAHMIELDVQLSRDGHVVVMHDDTVDRTTDGHGAVGALDLARLKMLDAGSWFGERFAGERVPTLAEALAATSLPVNVELKRGGGDALAAGVYDTVRNAGAIGRVVFSSFEDDALARMRRLDAHVEIAVLRASGTMGHAVRAAERLGTRTLHLRNTKVWMRQMRDTASEGYMIRIWTVNSLAEWAPFSAAGASGLFTDHPDRFLQFPTV
jgi:glycerophosphoryl diester phosphodiesterase